MIYRLRETEERPCECLDVHRSLPVGPLEDRTTGFHYPSLSSFSQDQNKLENEQKMIYLIVHYSLLGSDPLPSISLQWTAFTASQVMLPFKLLQNSRGLVLTESKPSPTFYTFTFSSKRQSPEKLVQPR